MSTSPQPALTTCLANILRIATALVPKSNWHTLHIDGYIVGSITEVKSWYTLSALETRIEYNTFDLDYINEDSDNNEIGNFVEQIRELTYDPARGAWYSVSIDFYSSGIQPSVRYNYYDQPNFSTPVPLTLYKKDLKVFPQPAQTLPEWLK